MRKIKQDILNGQNAATWSRVGRLQSKSPSLLSRQIDPHPIASPHFIQHYSNLKTKREREEILLPMAEEAKKSYWGMAARECDACRTSRALLFCRADSAFLCGACDCRVHAANALASRHERVWMCEVCEQAPAAFTCKADAAALCTTCDSDIHSANPLARRHERSPVVPFFHSPSLPVPAAAPDLLLKPSDDDDEDEGDNEREAEAASWLFENHHPKAVEMETPEVKVAAGEQYFFNNMDSYFDMEYGSSMDNTRFHHHQADSVVPVQNRAAQIHHHPRSFFPTPVSGGSYEIDFTSSDKPSYSFAPSLSHSVSSSEVGVVPEGSAVTDISNSTTYGLPANQAVPVPAAAVGMDREARVMRYREKRKNRKFEKTIRYASRKAYAETRPRIKGRFAKRTDNDGEAEVGGVDSIFSSSSSAAAVALMVDTGYRVVPSF